MKVSTYPIKFKIFQKNDECYKMHFDEQIISIESVHNFKLMQ